MIGDLLEISRIEARRLVLDQEVVNLPTLVQAVVERAAAATQGHQVRLDVRKGIPPVCADPVRLEQVLGNLLSNAAKYGYPNAKILVAVEHKDGVAEISVTNRGPGISPDEMPKLFGRFYRTQEARTDHTEGLGLGLYISDVLHPTSG